MSEKLTEEEIDAAAKFLRETLQSGKRLLPWERAPKSAKKKWIALAAGALEASRAILKEHKAAS